MASLITSIGLAVVLLALQVHCDTVPMHAGDCALLAQAPVLTEISSCKRVPACTVFTTAAAVDPDLATLYCERSKGRVVVISYFPRELNEYADPITAYGTLPASWSGLTSLQILAMGKSVVKGTLPLSWTALPNLWKVDLSDNFLTAKALGSVWTKLKNLQELNLANNNFRTTLPKEWHLIPKLRILDISGANMTGTLPAEWAKMPAIQELWLQNNKLNGTLPAVWGSLKNLKVMSLAVNKFSGTLPPAWGSKTAGLRRLAILDLANNTLTGIVPSSWLYIGCSVPTYGCPNYDFQGWSVWKKGGVIVNPGICWLDVYISQDWYIPSNETWRGKCPW